MIFNPAIKGGKETLSWHQCPEAVRNYLAYVAANPYNPNDYSYTYITDYAPAVPVQSNTKPIGLTVDNTTFYNNVPNEATPFSTTNKAGTLAALDRIRWINTHSITWVEGVNAFGSKSTLDAYVTSAQDIAYNTLFRVYPDETRNNQRTFYIWEDELLFFSYFDVGYNVRDLGGWQCDGGTIKYGVLVRGGDTNPADKDLMVNEIGIKTEVRTFEKGLQGLDHSVWDIEMIANPSNVAPAYNLDSTAWKGILGGIFDSVINNKPVYFHCGAGADRTGSVAVVLETLLGVSESDCAADYEITSFSTGASSATVRSRSTSDYQNFISTIKSVTLVGGLSDTFQNHVISFVASLGFSVDVINAFRSACIDGTPNLITLNLNTYSITKTGDISNVVFDNDTASVKQFNGYECEISAISGTVISNITITMGGIDVTDNVFSGTEGLLKYSVNKTLNNSTINNQKTKVIDGEGYGAIVIPDANNTIESITVTMGGADITTSVVTLVE